MNKKVGNFEGRINGPYPCWIEIRIGNERALGFRHDELSDLEYLIKQLKKEAKLKLGKDADEV